ncbi:SGNH/GDSL hydrolase family protein [Colwellia piezophila]|uniref:SGNH/GDSL hydrolase family protein n=1 Tax=Colwellia piezophila TaxID=211668 RepID=UPI000378B872|nr:SGNH/GDSL hydrolase family protein [Colwellia piezophila]
MYKNIVVIVTLSLTWLTLTHANAAVEPGSFEQQARKLTWAVEPQANLPNVLIIGDSISIGYTLGVRELLKGKANVYRPIKQQGKLPDNGGDTRKGLRSIENWLKTQGVKQWQVIHFNWGLHDLKRITKGMGVKSNDANQPAKLSIKQYAKNLEELVKRLQLTGAKLIFATTTPYPTGVTPSRIPNDAVLYNQAALAVMARHQVQVNDLYNKIKPNLTTLQQPVNVHFNKQGSQFLAEKVSEVIKPYLAG